MTFVFATAMFLLESLIDVFKTEVETIASTAAAASSGWMQNQLKLFQYDVITPQIVQLINFAPSYPVVDASKRIISRASVVTTLAGNSIIKLATSEPPQALSALQLSAAQSYVNAIGATVSYLCVSSPADQIYINADVYYQGQYSAIIKQSVIDAINNYLANFSNVSFNGALKVSDIETTIKNVTGVNDSVLRNVITRSDATPFANGTYLVQNSQYISRIYSSQAGYIVSETTTSHTLADSLNFIAQ
ncbi:hypothetical protein [Mucilaginibacter sp. 10I4]|uniref:hypothetical protein n=1 Tax=Mucilaginibacter sp. 10I4 TaxID=3048580 RepID=UPI002B228515|nr:hypothetical protein [Mucilaginibacter sp. 10I4]MEB0262922.1 hypothetical protein [Mucilaginibacter sp. 10I4]